MPTLTPELVEGKPISTTEPPPPQQGDTQKEATIMSPTPEAIHDQLKPSTPTTSDENTSVDVPAEQTAKVAATEMVDTSLQTTEDLAGYGTVEGSGDSEDRTVSPTDAKEDPKSTKNIKRAKSDENISSGELSDGDSQNSDAVDDAISEEEHLAYTAKGTELYKKRAPKRIKQFEQYFWNVEYRINLMEEELKKLREADLSSKLKDDLSSKLKDDAKETSAEPLKVIPSIQRLTWADYRPSLSPHEASDSDNFGITPRIFILENNEHAKIQKKGKPKPAKVSGDLCDELLSATTKYQHHVLEVLVEDPGTNKRRRAKKHSDDGNITRASRQNARSYQKSDPISSQTSTVTLQCPERVRICSRPLMAILRNMVDPNGPPWNIPHMVILRPFKMFVMYEAEIRDALKVLERVWLSKKQNTPTEKASEHKPKEQHGENREPNNEGDKQTALDPAADDSVKVVTFEALSHFRLLIDFLDSDLESTFDLRKRIKAKTACPIAFADLWHLYEHGQEVRTQNDNLQVFKVARFTGGRDLMSEFLPEQLGQVPSSSIEREESNGAFFLECYRYGFDGTHYGPIHHMIEIRRYEGLRDITSLQVYPLCFGPEHKKERVQLVQRGEKFMALARVNKTAHKTYSGLSLDEHAEEIESPIIVDFQLAISKGNIQSPSIGYQSRLDYDFREWWEDFQYLCGFEGCESWDETFGDHRFDIKLSERFLSDQKPHLARVEDPEELGEDERILLPCSVHGSVLRSRKWRTININNVDEIKYNDCFDDLVLPPGYKDTLEALVNRHSRGTETIGGQGEIISSMDLVTGKGKGLVILLHGAPGVGKTSAAECVADKTERPLFPITCGDLGESAIEVEESLERSFSLAHRWGCVLLLDEADVFLAVRSQTDLRRNAVVSVFLRTLEYYSGVLFLTTNRVGALDPAFKSRIHISLYYPKLGRKASTEIWRYHIKRAKDHFEEKGEQYSLREREIIEFSKHFRYLKNKEAEPWNGRQIRNAFRTAIALAEHEAYLNGGKPELRERHFAKVAKASSDFDWYLKTTHGRSESQLAEAAKMRTDDPERVAKKMAAIAQHQRPRGQPKSEDESNIASSSEETLPPKASKKVKKKQNAPWDGDALTKRAKKERRKQESASEEELPARKKSKKEKAKHESSEEEEEEAPPVKKNRKGKEEKRKKREPSSDEDDQESSESEKEVKKSGKETKGKEKEKGKEKAKSTSKTFN